MKKIIALALASVFVLSGCNTVKGAGKDIEKGGEKVQEVGKDASDALKKK